MPDFAGVTRRPKAMWGAEACFLRPQLLATSRKLGLGAMPGNPRLREWLEAYASFILGNRLYWLLLLAPVSWAVSLLGLPELWIFITAALAIIPLAGLIGEATEELVHWVGQGIGGILNATLGNATELIIGLLALRAGLQQVVKASISGSIIGNILLVLGLAMLFGGWGRGRQTFNRTHAGASVAMLLDRKSVV